MLQKVGLFRRSARGPFYARVCIPACSRPYFQNRVQCWLSLRTSDRQLAKVRAAQWYALTQKLFYVLQTKGSKMSPSQIAVLVNQWRERTQASFEASRVADLPTMSDDQRDFSEELCVEECESAHSALTFGDYQAVSDELDMILKTFKLPPVNHASPAYAKLAREFLKTKLDVYKEEVRRWQGDYAPTSSASAAGAVTAPVVIAAERTKMFSEVLALYMADTKNAQRRPRTKSQIESGLKKFIGAIGGDKPIGEITEADGMQYQESMKRDGLGLSSMNKRFHYLSHLWKWGKSKQGRRVIPKDLDDPAEGLRADKATVRKQAGKVGRFSSEQLRIMVNHPIFKREREAQSERHWITILAMYTGARREEVAQLLVSQVVQDKASGVWYFNIQDDELADQHLKNEGSRRHVPLHHDLLDHWGFLDYLEATKKAKQTRLFYQSTKNVYGYGNATGQWFNRVIHTKLNMNVKPKVVFHSFRHTFVSSLHEADVPDKVIFNLVGHEDGVSEVHKFYDHSTIPLTKLRDAVNKLDMSFLWKPQ